VFDLLFGSALAHLLATGAGPSPEDSRQIARVLINGLKLHEG
jgi:hypothetical protein